MKTTKTKKFVALLSVLAVGTASVACLAMASRLTDGAFGVYAASTDDETTAIAGAEDNPVAATEGTYTISYMVVNGDQETGYFKELVYYMTFTPDSTGNYTFTHSTDEIGVVDVFTESGDWAYGEWNDDWTVYTVSLVADTQYTLYLTSYDWDIDLDDYDVGDVYEFDNADDPYTLTIAKSGTAVAGSSQSTAITYNVGDKIIVPQGGKTVWYSLTVEEDKDVYVIAFGGTAVVKKGLKSETATNGYITYKVTSGTTYISVTSTATTSAEVQLLEQSAQSSGSCIATAIEITGDTQIGGVQTNVDAEDEDPVYRGNWYKYTATADGTLTLSVVEAEENVSVSASVDVYVGFVYSESLYASTYVENSEEEEPADSDTLALTEGVTYYFYVAPYTDANDNLSVATLTFGN